MPVEFALESLTLFARIVTIPLLSEIYSAVYLSLQPRTSIVLQQPMMVSAFSSPYNCVSCGKLCRINETAILRERAVAIVFSKFGQTPVFANSSATTLTGIRPSPPTASNASFRSLNRKLSRRDERSCIEALSSEIIRNNAVFFAPISAKRISSLLITRRTL